MLKGLRERLVGVLGGVPRSAVREMVVAEMAAANTRDYPLQKVDRFRFMYAPQPEMEEAMLNYAVDVWVRTAVAELATDFASAPLEIWRRNAPAKAEGHGLLELLGPSGKPNPDQDRFEFLETSYSDLVLSGNCYWYWHSQAGGAPQAVYVLPPQAIFVVPGESEVVGGYVARWQGTEIRLHKDSVTHLKTYHPLNKYYGLSALEALRIEVRNDRNMAKWNAEFFGDDVFQPAGIMFVPEGTSEQERRRLEAELEGKHGKRRRTMVMRVPAAGSQSWADAGLKHREIEFKEGRLLSRQAVFECLGLPLGLYSESSTEAHARVAERHKLGNVYKWHTRFATKIDQDVLSFWPGASRYQARFYDVRKVDWQMEAFKIKALSSVMTVDEIREREYQMPPIDEGVAPAARLSSGNGGLSEPDGEADGWAGPPGVSKGGRDE